MNSPLTLTAEQRKANSAAMLQRIARARDRVANDKTQTKRVRDANRRDAATLRSRVQ